MPKSTNGLGVLTKLATRFVFCVGLCTITASILVAIYFTAGPKNAFPDFLKKWLSVDEPVTSSKDLPDKLGRLTVTVTPLHIILNEFKYHVEIQPTGGKRISEDLEIQSGGPPNVTIVWVDEGVQSRFLGFEHDVGGRNAFEFISFKDGTIRRSASKQSMLDALKLPRDTKLHAFAWINTDLILEDEFR